MIIGIDNLQLGSIIFVRSNSWLSTMIRYVLGSKYSHVAAYAGIDAVIEADWDGVRVNSLSAKYMDNPNYTLEIVNPPLTKEQLRVFLDFVGTKLGDHYDFWLFGGGIISRIFHRSRRLAGLYNRERDWVCSELIAAGLEKAGMSFPYPVSQMTPKDLHAALYRR